MYLLVGELGLRCGGSRGELLFPPSGIAVAAPLIYGLRVWPGVFAGAWLLGMTTVNAPLLVGITAMGNTLEGMAVAWFINHHAGGARFYEQPVSIVKFVLLAGVLSPLLCPPFGLGEFSLRSLMFWTLDPATLRVWWLGETTSVLVLTPLLAVWATRFRVTWNLAQSAEYTALMVLLLLVNVGVFAILPPAWAQGFLLPYLCLPFPLWAALRFGPGATTIAISVQALVSLWGTLHGFGLFAWTTPDKALMAYQGFTSFNAVMGLLVAAVVWQREEMKLTLQRAYGELEQRVMERTRDLSMEVEVRKKVEVTLAQTLTCVEQRVKERTAELSEANQRLEQENRQRRSAEEALSRVLQRLIDAQETERRRLARELHDEMGPDLTALKLGLQNAARARTQPQPVPPPLTHLEELTDRIMHNVHRMAWELRPPALDDLGLVPALQRFTEEWSARTGIAVGLHNFAPHAVRLPARIETALYRITQEALTNVLKHSKAQRVSVLLDRQPQRVSLIVEDNGQGFEADEYLSRPSPNGGMGLVGMQERVSSVGGTLQIESARNAGATLYVRIPLNEPLLEA
ncbi:MAG: MASE1 domain-containing protein [Verrucomicrobia bacterium]|nr:MASE1 domain-containing protein [Verrucomicrobiota bacterium]